MCSYPIYSHVRIDIKKSLEFPCLHSEKCTSVVMWSSTIFYVRKDSSVIFLNMFTCKTTVYTVYINGMQSNSII